MPGLPSSATHTQAMPLACQSRSTHTHARPQACQVAPLTCKPLTLSHKRAVQYVQPSANTGRTISDLHLCVPESGSIATPPTGGRVTIVTPCAQCGQTSHIPARVGTKGVPQYLHGGSRRREYTTTHARECRRNVSLTIGTNKLGGILPSICNGVHFAA
eukprot:6117417-Amphidinium_carterae.1